MFKHNSTTHRLLETLLYTCTNEPNPTMYINSINLKNLDPEIECLGFIRSIHSHQPPFHLGSSRFPSDIGHRTSDIRTSSLPASKIKLYFNTGPAKH